MADYFTIITIKMAYCNQLLSIEKQDCKETRCQSESGSGNKFM